MPQMTNCATFWSINKTYPIAELLAACKRYVDAMPKEHVTFEYVMLDGVNDSDTHARQLSKLLRQVPSKINTDSFNPFPGSECRRSPRTYVRSTISCGLTVTSPPAPTRRRYRRRLRATGSRVVPRSQGRCATQHPGRSHASEAERLTRDLFNTVRARARAAWNTSPIAALISPCVI